MDFPSKNMALSPHPPQPPAEPEVRGTAVFPVDRPLSPEPADPAPLVFNEYVSSLGPASHLPSGCQPCPVSLEVWGLPEAASGWALGSPWAGGVRTDAQRTGPLPYGNRFLYPFKMNSTETKLTPS